MTANRSLVGIASAMPTSITKRAWRTKGEVAMNEEMNEEQFRQRAQEQGYGEVQPKDYVPNRDGPLHAHEFSVLLLVVEGQFSLAFEDHTTSYLPGEVCELAANVMHTERAGPSGAKVLLAKRGVGA